MAKSGGGVKLLGVAPHACISRHIAKKTEPDLFLNELSKAEELPVAMYQHLVPHYTNLTQEVNEKL